jgi:hypothetical protein
MEGSASLYSNNIYSAGAGWWDFLIHKTRMTAHAGDRFHFWHKTDDSKHTWLFNVVCIEKPGCAQGPTQGWPYYTTTICSGIGAEGWSLKKGTLPPSVTDYDDQRWAYWGFGFNDYGTLCKDWFDHFVTSSSQYLTVTGLVPGQVVEVYRSSDDAKIDTQTCLAEQTRIISDLDNQDYPLYLYLKVYASDGVTLIESTTPQRICGGDTWYWVPPFGTLAMETDAFVLIRSGGTGTPQSANIVATLRTPAGNPAPGKTIQFTTSRGTVDPTSDVTDANGQASTTLTADTHGLAIVKAVWIGDADIPAAVGYATHHVLYNAEAPDVTKKFQFFIEGVEFAFENGHYSSSTTSDPQEFSVEIPEWLSTITKRGLVSIYRYGVKDFGGIASLFGRKMAESPVVTIGGTDASSLLETRVVTMKDYSGKTLGYILEDLFDSYPCGLFLGSLSDYPNPVTATFADETFVSTVTRICDMIGWLYRVNVDNTVDIKPDFGVTTTVEFIEGQSLFVVDYTEDYRRMSNSIRMRGLEDMVSTAIDSASVENIGLVEDVAFQKSIGDQSVLDIAAAAELARSTSGVIQITADVLDEYVVGGWVVGDWVTLTCEEVELSGLYRVIKVTRDMADPTFATVEFANKAAVQLMDLFDRLKRELKDLNAKTAI